MCRNFQRGLGKILTKCNKKWWTKELREKWRRCEYPDDRSYLSWRNANGIYPKSSLQTILADLKILAEQMPRRRLRLCPG